jgi:acyl carrier protein
MKHTNLEDDNILEEHTDLLEAGLLDSLLTVSLISFCEEKFCEMDLEELSLENFSSLGALADFVRRGIERKAGSL